MNLFKISRVYTLTNDKHFRTLSEVASTMELCPLREDLSIYISRLKDALSKEEILSGDGRSAPHTTEIRKNYRSLNLLSTVVKKTLMVASISDDENLRKQAEDMQRIYAESNVAQNLKLETAIARYSTLCNNINERFSTYELSAVGIGETIKKMTKLCEDCNKMLEERNQKKGTKKGKALDIARRETDDILALIDCKLQVMMAEMPSKELDLLVEKIQEKCERA
ncbi:MAG: hypothetical protein KBT22_06325 [Bacteroidales bacterium]|nr:hypothetical protein [Candidatus Scybalocola fimicaballi]